MDIGHQVCLFFEADECKIDSRKSNNHNNNVANVAGEPVATLPAGLGIQEVTILVNCKRKNKDEADNDVEQDVILIKAGKV